jgi:ATP-binding cassette subfamily C protein
VNRFDASPRELAASLGRSRAAFLGVGAMSGLINLLYLTGSLFMLEVYDRVIPGRSVPTLIGLSLLAFGLYLFQGALDALRARILSRIGAALDADLGRRTFDLVVRAPLKGAGLPDGLAPLRDLDTVRGFFAGTGPGALFDLPWIPVYLAICFLFHPLIGVAALCGGLVLVAFTLVTEATTRAPTRASTAHGQTRTGLAEAGRRNAEILAALGMQETFGRRWSEANAAFIAANQRVADIAGGFGAAAKVFRMMLQSGVLALGAWLVIRGEASAGVIIASSILVSRTLAPAELAVANWKGFVAARQAWHRLSDRLARLPAVPRPHRLPAPTASLAVEALAVAPPGSPRLVARDLSFRIHAGQALGVIGPSASGKSSLVRALVGVWPAALGSVRLDGASLDQWTAQTLGPHLGYLPQEAELFAGTVAENIARFTPDPSPEAVVAAARAAGAHELILRLPEGYDTRLGEAGAGLSAGQRQRVGLARALYGDPFLVVLDEPNANLDAEGEHALTRAILGIRERGGICIVVAHRPSALSAVDLVLVMAEGRAQAFGPKDEVLRRVLRPAGRGTPPQPGGDALQESA